MTMTTLLGPHSAQRRLRQDVRRLKKSTRDFFRALFANNSTKTFQQVQHTYVTLPARPKLFRKVYLGVTRVDGEEIASGQTNLRIKLDFF